MTKSEHPQILQTGPLMPMIETQLTAHFKVHRLDNGDPAAVLAECGPDIRAIATAAGPRAVDSGLIAALPRLEIIANFGVGYDSVDVAAAAARGIVVTNTPGVLDDEVADLAVALLLATVRRLPQADRFVREGRWRSAAFPLSASLRDRRIGIVGMGRIGRVIAQRLAAFGRPLAYHSRTPVADVPYRHYGDLRELARDVDILVVIVPGGAATRRLINREVLEALGPTGILINVARGSVVDEEALIRALQDGTIAAAGLDVFANEPDVPEPLRAMDNVVLLPHVASATGFTRHAMGQLVVDNLLAWSQGRAPLTPVPETPVAEAPLAADDPATRPRR